VTIQTDRCCDACYNSHGGCIEHGSCLCHAGEHHHLTFSDAARAAKAFDALRSGAPWADPYSACVAQNGFLTARYPEGAEMERAILSVDRFDGTVIRLTLGVWVTA
jgi:hypothetical protein